MTNTYKFTPMQTIYMYIVYPFNILMYMAQQSLFRWVGIYINCLLPSTFNIVNVQYTFMQNSVEQVDLFTSDFSTKRIVLYIIN